MSEAINEVKGVVGQAMRSMSMKIFLIIVIMIVLLAPQMMVRHLVQERQARSEEVESKIAAGWGGAQVLQGPLLAVPFTRLVRERDKSGMNIVEREETVWGYAWPDDLKLKAVLKPEERQLGLFSTVVYRAQSTLAAVCRMPEATDLGLAAEWKRQPQLAKLYMGFSDVQGLTMSACSVNGQARRPQNGLGGGAQRILEKGFQIEVKPEDFKENLLHLDCQFSLGGTRRLAVLPSGRESFVDLSSTWGDCGYAGGFPPEFQTVAQGSHVQWRIQDLQRSFAQFFSEERPVVQGGGPSSAERSRHYGADLATGAAVQLCRMELVQLNDVYQRTERVVKYSFLFILFTFGAVFICERLSGCYIHPLQYLLTGVASILFFVLLLSLSEHMAFNKAYLAAAAVVTLMICGYTRAMFASGKMSAIMLGTCSLLYLYLFSTLQMEDYALLTGTLGLTLVTALVMFLTRKLNREASPRPG